MSPPISTSEALKPFARAAFLFSRENGSFSREIVNFSRGFSVFSHIPHFIYFAYLNTEKTRAIVYKYNIYNNIYIIYIYLYIYYSISL